MPEALSLGVPYEVFWHLNPTKMKPFYNAYERKQEELDRMMWVMGQYVAEAINCNFSKRHYPNAPFSEQKEPQAEIYDDETMPQEELDKKKQMQLELLFARLDVIGRNANLEKKRKETEKESESEETETEQ